MTAARPLLAALSLLVTPLAASGTADGCVDRAIASCDARLSPDVPWLTPLRGWCYLAGLEGCAVQ